MSDVEIIKILQQLLKGLQFMHLNKILHLDIKPQNILVFPNSVFKFADFGHSLSFDDFKNNRLKENFQFGTKFFWAP